MTGHVIICGYGRVGRAAAEFLAASGHEVVVVDSDAGRLEQLGPGLTLPPVRRRHRRRRAPRRRHRAGPRAHRRTRHRRRHRLRHPVGPRDPTRPGDHRPRADTDSKAKMLLAGASRAINPQRIGGRRMAGLRAPARRRGVPRRRDARRGPRLPHPAGPRRRRVRAWWVVRWASSTSQERTGALLLAIRRGGGQPFEPHPPADVVVPPGAVLIALGTQAELDELSRLGSP